VSLVIFSAIYALIFLAGAVYIYRLLQRGPVHLPSFDNAATNPKRPLSIAGRSPGVRAAAPILEMRE
jgi:cytochrome bd ubiquinol oxidase subunit I